MIDSVPPAVGLRVGQPATSNRRVRSVVLFFSLVLGLPAAVGVVIAGFGPEQLPLSDPSSGDSAPQGEDVYGWVKSDPSARSGHAMAYDSESDRVIMFGSGETWAYDFNVNWWTELMPAMSPPPLSGHTMAYDSQSDRVILFGGSGSDETWAYDFNTNTWTDMAPAVTPPGRATSAMTYDSESDRVILFGGTDANFVRLNDTWAYDFETNIWTDMAPSVSPPAREGHAMAYSSLSDRAVVFGGLSGARFTNETWVYDLNTNIWMRPSLVVSPAGRYLHAMAYDSQSDRVILFGGGVSGIAFSGTWALDLAGSTWTARNPAAGPMPRFSPAMAYDEESDRVILFRGASMRAIAFPPPRDLWAYDFEADAWTLMQDSPPPLRQLALAYDSESDRTILFGGWRIIGGIGGSDITWAYDVDARRWTNLDPAIRPAFRYWHTMAYDSESDRVILFGGCCPGGRPSADTWAYDFNTNTWTDMAPAVRPSGRFSSAMAYDSESDRIILFGGSTGSDETWSYDFNTNTWTLLAPLLSPSARSGHAMAYDSESDRVILFGGSGSDETWSYDFNLDMWLPLISLTRPSARTGHAMAYDSESDLVILFGGETVDGPSDETWSFDSDTHTWTSLSPETHPSARSLHAMAYDSQSDRVVLFGGVWDDTWLFHFLSKDCDGLQLTPPRERVALGLLC